MSNILYFPLLNPMRFYLPQPSTQYHSRHIEDFEFYDTIPEWSQHVDYKQPWQNDDLIKLFLIADFSPHVVNVVDLNGNIITSVEYQQLQPNVDNPSLHLYRLDIDLTDIPHGIYRLQQISGIDDPLILQSNKIEICTTHKHTLVLDYQSDQYHEGIFFKDSSGTSIYYPSLRVEGANLFKLPASKGAADFEDQPLDLTTLSATAYNVYELIIGDAGGVPDYLIDIINRIFTCNDVRIDGRRFVKPIGNQWEVNEIDGYLAKGWKTEVRPANNRPSRKYVNNAPVNAKVAVMITVGSKGFGADTGGTTYEITNVE